MIGKAAGELLCPNNGSLESMQVKRFHRGKTVKCTLMPSSNFYFKKTNKRTFKIVMMHFYSVGALCPSDQEATI